METKDIIEVVMWSGMLVFTAITYYNIGYANGLMDKIKAIMTQSRIEINKKS